MIDQQAAGMLVTLFAGVVVMVGVRAWRTAYQRIGSGQAAIAAEYSPPLPISLVDILLIFFLQMVAESWAVNQVDFERGVPLSELPNQQQLAVVFQLNLARLGVFGVGMLLLHLFYARYMRAHVGSSWPFSVRRWLSDLRLGGTAFCMLAPPVLALQMALAFLWQPSQHSIIDMLRGADDRWQAVLVCGVAAVVAAPLFEEFFFRGLLHGWLDRCGSGRSSDRATLLFNPAPAVNRQKTPNETADAAAVSSADVSSTDGDETQVTAGHVEHVADPRDLSAWPLYISSAVFALMHYGNGPDPIPLFFFALGLGYLYRHTGRLTPCIVVHFLLNAFSFALLLIGTMAEAK